MSFGCDLMAEKRSYESGTVTTLVHPLYSSCNCVQPYLQQSFVSVYSGSHIENWHSIMRAGLINASGTQFEMNGAAYGKGVYLSPQASLSFGYSAMGFGHHLPSEVSNWNILMWNMWIVQSTSLIQEITLMGVLWKCFFDTPQVLKYTWTKFQTCTDGSLGCGGWNTLGPRNISK